MSDEQSVSSLMRRTERSRPPRPCSILLALARGVVLLPIHFVVTLAESGLLIIRLVRFQPLVSLLLGFVFGHAITFLKFADQAVPFAGNHLKIIVGKFSPLLLGSAFHLFPFSGHLIRVHKDLTPNLKVLAG